MDPTCYVSIAEFSRVVGIDRTLVTAAIKSGSPLPAQALGTWTSPKGTVMVLVAGKLGDWTQARRTADGKDATP